MAVDPVCRMTVDELKAVHKTEYGGNTVYFCSAGCKLKFESDPGKYLHVSPALELPETTGRGPAMEEPAAGLYFCPMHPHITAKVPGRCPECGMKLEAAVRGNSGGKDGHGDSAIADFKRRFWISTALTIPIVLLSPMVQMWLGLGESIRFPGDLLVLFVLSSAVFFYGGLPFLRGLAGEVRSSRPGMMTLIAMAIGVAYVYSSIVVFGISGSIFFWELATLIDIMLLGHLIEMRSVQGASRALEELANLMPAVAHRMAPGGRIDDVPLTELRPGDRVLVKPGEKVPADGVVAGGESSVDEALLTGESAPVPKSTGGSVIGGSLNGDGSLTVEIKKTGADSFIAQVIALVNEAQKTKSHTQDIADRAALWLTAIATIGGAVTLAAWLIIAKSDFAFALERTVTVMVVTCPHALGLAIPLVVAVSTALAARRGLLIRNRRAFENARKIQTVIFDKTGTLTTGRFGVVQVLPLGGTFGKDEILRYAASVERHSGHPIARAIAGASADPYPVDEFTSMPGKGARGLVTGRKVEVVSEAALGSPPPAAEELTRLRGEGKTIVFVLVDGELAGAIALADVIRPESRDAVRELKKLGIRCVMLTGDHRNVAEWVARDLGLDEFFADVMPEGKAARVREVQARGFTVAVAGDGVNDAPALAQADVGIAVGAGTDVAIETADIVLVRNNPLDIVHVVQLARTTYAKMIQNLLWATGYNVIAIPLAAGVLAPLGILLSPALGAVLMSASTVIVAVNARMLRV